MRVTGLPLVTALLVVGASVASAQPHSRNHAGCDGVHRADGRVRDVCSGGVH